MRRRLNLDTQQHENQSCYKDFAKETPDQTKTM